MVPTSLVQKHEKRTPLLAKQADRIVAAIAKRGSMSRRELRMQRCYRTLDARDRELVVAAMLRSGRLVLRDTRTCESQPASHGIRYFAGAQD